MLRRVHGARGLVLVRPPSRSPRVPVLGRVAAGVPWAAVEDPEDAIEIPPGPVQRRPDLMLRVVGDSMSGAGILDGDLIAVTLTMTADNGQIVVARLDDEITVKRLRSRGKSLQREADHPDYAPIRVTADRDFSIEGRVIGVVRRF